MKVRFEPDGIEVAPDGPVTVAEAAHEAGLSLHLPCGGRGTCGKCRVMVLEGELSPPGVEELETLGPDDLARGVRLACRARVTGDAVIMVAPEARVVGTKELNGDLVRPVEVHPNVHQIPLQLPQPELSDQRADFDRLSDSLGGAASGPEACPRVLRKLPAVLREADFRAVASMVGGRVVDVHPGGSPPATCGVAVDIGTTTVVAYAADLLTGQQVSAAAAHNEQGRRGADVISRIEHCTTEPGGLEELRGLVLDTVNRVIRQALARAERRVEDLYEVTVVGNTAMHHLFLGLDPQHLAHAPYVPVTARPQQLRPQDAGINMHPGGNVFCLPVIAGFVGADTVGVILATELTERSLPTLAVDIGTNGEVALWSGERLLVASCAAGPAFEGAQIEHGMRAAPGAIEHITLGNGDVRVKTIDDATPVGICGSGLFDAMAALLEMGAVEPSGRFVDGDLPDGMPPALRERLAGEGPDRRFVFAHTADGTPVFLGQRDVRELQLAKGAVRAAVELLLEMAGLEAGDLHEVLLAGAFGNFINPGAALRMGLLPDIPRERIKGVGNAAGAGALLALVSTHERERAVRLAATAEHIELSRRPEFQMAFMETMLFPEG